MKRAESSPLGYAYAISFVFNFDSKSSRDYLVAGMKGLNTASVQFDKLLSAWIPLVRVPDRAHVMLAEHVGIGSMDQVEASSTDIAAMFDMDVLIPERQLQQHLKDLNSNSK